MDDIERRVAGTTLHQAADIIQQAYPNVIDYCMASIKNIIDQASKIFLRDCDYVLCFSEICDSILMWSHYAHGHTGVVLQIDTRMKNMEGFSHLMKRVRYSDFLPAFFEDQYSRFYEIGELADEMEILWYRVTRTKSSAWAYEKEWRAFSGLHPNNQLMRGDLTTLWGFFRQNISGVYIGCKTATEETETIARLTKAQFPQATIWRGRRAKQRFAIEFEPVL